MHNVMLVVQIATVIVVVGIYAFVSGDKENDDW